MPNITVENIEDDFHHQLCELAEEEGQSVEELIRAILRKAIESKQIPHLAARLMDRFATDGLKDSEVIEEIKGQPVKPPEFGQ